MSQNHGARLVRQSTSNKPVQLGQDRPSLFTDINAQDGDTQRVRILSTLESSHRPKRSQKRRNWQTASLMGMGVLILLASFVAVIMDGRHNRVKPEPAVMPSALADKGRSLQGRAEANKPLAGLIVPTPNTSGGPHPAAVIENVAGAGPIEDVPPPKQGRDIQAAHKVALVSNKQPHARAITADTAINARPSPASSSTPVKRSMPGKTKDDDVALLQAMFAHTRARQPPPTVGEEIKQRCGGLNGADAATCRARVCVLNTTAAACHQD